MPRGTWLRQLGSRNSAQRNDRRTTPSKVFIGPTYYQRLKHMVLDKQHSRSRGPVQILTRQPVEGRAREGGLRFGEMERDCIIRYAPSPCAHQNHSHPLYTPLHSRWQPRCGKRPVRASLRTIGSIRRNRMRQLRTRSHNLPPNTQLIRQKKPFCRVCKSHTAVHDVRMPYAFKLLLQELMAMNIAARLRLKCDHTDEPAETTISSVPKNLVMATA